MCKLYFIAFFALINTVTFGQNKAETVLKNNTETFPQEKVHLFFNKEQYVSGETIWFKAYLFSGYVKSNISTNLYVELYNAHKILIDKIQVPLIESIGNGSLKLSNAAPEGVYFVRAYTKWMMNFDEKFQYITELPVYNAASELTLSNKPVSWTMTAHPESGILMEEEENNVAVRLHATGSLPARWKGYIVERNDSINKILNFESINPQLAAFTFKPQKGKAYLLHCYDNAGNKAVTLLRTANKGVLLQAKQEDKNLLLNLSFRNLPNNGLNYKILAHMQGDLVYKAVIKNSTPTVQTAIPVDKLMNGVVHVTVFDEQENPVAERLVFVKVENNSPAIAPPAKSIVKEKRALNEWPMNIDTAGMANYALSITDPAITTTRKRNILSDIWLGDFASGIYSPASYFNGSPLADKALDALMITEKWSRFSWNELLNSNTPSLKFKPEKYLSYTGTALRKGTPIVEENINILFRYKDSSTQITQVKTDKDGKFQMVNTIFFDTANVFYQPNKTKVNAKDISIQFEAHNGYIPLKSALPATAFTLVKREDKRDIHPLIKREEITRANTEKADKRYKQLEEVKMIGIKKTATEKLVDELTTGVYSSAHSYTFDFVNENQMVDAYSNIYDWLEGRVPGLQFEIIEGVKVPMIRGSRTAVLIDEVMQVQHEVAPSDGDLGLDFLDVQQIALVQVIRGGSAALPGGGAHGAILIYMKKGSKGGFAKSKLSSAQLIGYRQPAPYTQVDYTGFENKLIQTDMRSQLYWSEYLTKDSIRFYNNDEANAYFVTLTGFSSDGRPIYVEKIIK